MNQEQNKAFWKKIFFLVDALDSLYNCIEALPSMKCVADQAAESKTPDKINVIYEAKEEPFDSNQDAANSCLGIDAQQLPIA